MASGAFFDEIVRHCGLSAVFAEQTVKRALEKVGASEESATPADLERALPHLEKALALFLANREKEAALARLRRLAKG